MCSLQISDYGQLHCLESNSSGQFYYPVVEEDILTISSLVLRSSSLTISGGAHTFNGSSLPSVNSLHIDFSRFRWLSVVDSTTIEVASGVTMWDLRDYLFQNGLNLNVWNGGAAGPTVGGYLNAGGFGRSGLSEKDGGFWEIVAYIRICVPSSGAVLVIDRNHEYFKWLFGSAGSLAIILSVGIHLSSSSIPLQSNISTKCVPYLQNIIYNRHRYPAVFSHIPFLAQEADFLCHEKRLFWFSLLAYPEQHDISLKVLTLFCNEFSDYILPCGGWIDLPNVSYHSPAYHYIIERKSFIPPLLMDDDKTFFVNGIMSYLPIRSDSDRALLLNTTSFFTDLALRSGLRLYHQAEDFFSLILFDKYYDPNTWNSYLSLKGLLDPDKKLRSLRHS